jgi:hypothetical protein
LDDGVQTVHNMMGELTSSISSQPHDDLRCDRGQETGLQDADTPVWVGYAGEHVIDDLKDTMRIPDIPQRGEHGIQSGRWLGGRMGREPMNQVGFDAFEHHGAYRWVR